MTLSGTRFGTIEFTSEDIISFPEGVIGFHQLNQFVIVSTNDESAFRWLQAVEDPAIAFLVAFPERYVAEYTPVIKSIDATSLDISAETSHFVFVTANIPAGRPKDMTLNLAGPIVINAENRIGKQVVLDDQAYTTRYRVFAQSDQASGQAVA